MPNIDWNNEDHLSSLTAELRLYLKQFNYRSVEEKQRCSSCPIRYARATQQILEPEDNDAIRGVARISRRKGSKLVPTKTVGLKCLHYGRTRLWRLRSENRSRLGCH